MALICYVPKSFRRDKQVLIDRINEVIHIYESQGYTLTLRQLYYQLVARDIIENSQRSYKNTGNLINDARLAGLIDWESLEDRTRNLKGLSHWSSPASVIDSAAYSYRRNLWEGQEWYVEVWVEKEALSEVVGRAANTMDVSYFCCRGYVSQSEMWAAAMRLIDKMENGKKIKIFHLGDHDPSGIDMTRDITDRIKLFCEYHDDERDLDLFFDNFEYASDSKGNRGGIERIALNLDQVRTYNPPPNPAKVTDSRYGKYIDKYGESSWELDALEPKYINDLIIDEISRYVDWDRYNNVRAKMDNEKSVLYKVAENWEDVYNMYTG